MKQFLLPIFYFFAKLGGAGLFFVGILDSSFLFMPLGNDLLMQIQADVLQRPVVRSKTAETTALGAAYLAGLATGFWSGRDEIARIWRSGGRFEPSMPAAEREALVAGWQKAVGRAKGWAS